MHLYSVNNRTYLLLDGRNSNVQRFRHSGFVHSLCVMHSLDGVLILGRSLASAHSDEHPSVAVDFMAESFGRNGKCVSAVTDMLPQIACLVAYADLLGVKPFHTADYVLEVGGEAIRARINSQWGECKSVSVFPEGSDSVSTEALCLGEFDI